MGPLAYNTKVTKNSTLIKLIRQQGTADHVTLLRLFFIAEAEAEAKVEIEAETEAEAEQNQNEQWPRMSWFMVKKAIFSHVSISFSITNPSINQSINQSVNHLLKKCLINKPVSQVYNKPINI